MQRMKFERVFTHISMLALTLAWMAGSPSEAAFSLTNITSSGVPQSTGTTINISNTGSTNWAVWDNRSGSGTSTPAAPFATKAAGIDTFGTIGNIIGVASTNTRGSDSVTSALYPNTFTWSGGSAGLTGDGRLSGIFPSDVDELNAGVSVSITSLAPLPDGQYYQINLWGSSYRGTGTFSATSGATTIAQLGSSHGEAKQTELFQFAYNPGATGDSLLLSAVLTTDMASPQNSSHALIQAVSISIVPEPSVGMLLMGGLLCLGCRRRRV